MEIENQEETKHSLVFVGSPLLDILASCDEIVLDEFNLKSDDCVRAEDHHDSLFQTLFKSSDSRVSAGGSAQNTARVAKWALGNKAEVCFIGCTGEDEYKAFMITKLMSEEIRPIYIPVSSAKTGVCACLLSSDGKRSMCTRQGAASLFSTEHLNLENIANKLKRAHCVYVVGYFAVHSPGVLLELSRKCSPEQILSLSLSAEYVCRDSADVLAAVLPRVDVLFGNGVEVKAFVRALRPSASCITVEESVLKLREVSRQRQRIVIITQGSESVIVDEGFGDLKRFLVPQCPQIVDSVGCGDALAGAFLATYIHSKDVYQAVLSGIQAAWKILQVSGFQRPAGNICDIVSK